MFAHWSVLDGSLAIEVGFVLVLGAVLESTGGVMLIMGALLGNDVGCMLILGAIVRGGVGVALPLGAVVESTGEFTSMLGTMLGDEVGVGSICVGVELGSNDGVEVGEGVTETIGVGAGVGCPGHGTFSHDQVPELEPSPSQKHSIVGYGTPPGQS